MKNTITYLILLLAVTLAACSKDEQIKDEIPKNFIGKWVAERHPTDYFIEGMEYNFKSDLTFSGFYIELEFDGNVVVNRSRIPFGGTYSVSTDGKWLTILEDGDDPDRYYIKEFTDKKLVLSEYETSTDYIASFKKQ